MKKKYNKKFLFGLFCLLFPLNYKINYFSV